MSASSNAVSSPPLTLRRDIQVLKTYGAAPYAAALKRLEKQIKEKQSSVNEKIGVKVTSDKAVCWPASHILIHC